jgi:predicted RNA-binding protein with PIN domain
VTADPTLYLFDGYNLLYAGGFADVRELRDTLASYVALRGARGVLVLDGTGSDETRGPLEVRWAEHADALLERLAAEHRARERVCVVSSDAAVRGTAGREVQTLRSETFLRDMTATERVVEQEQPAKLADRLDDETRARLEQLRRGET